MQNLIADELLAIDIVDPWMYMVDRTAPLCFGFKRFTCRVCTTCIKNLYAERLFASACICYLRACVTWCPLSVQCLKKKKLPCTTVVAIMQYKVHVIMPGQGRMIDCCISYFVLFIHSFAIIWQ